MRHQANNDKLSILYVDDERSDLALFGFALKKADPNIWLHTVEDGEQGMSYLEGKCVYADRSIYLAPDLVVLDLKMPRMDGFDFLKWRKKSSKASRVPVVILSGSMSQAEERQALGLGAHACFVKRAEFDQFKETIQQIAQLGRKLKSQQ